MKAQTSSKKSAPSTAQRIRTLLSEGKTPVQIAMLLGIKRQYVYVVKSAAKKKAAPPKRGPGRPKGSKNKKVTPMQRMEQMQNAHISNLMAASAALTNQPQQLQGTVITPILQPLPEPKRTFWERVVYLFKGQ